MALKIKNSLIVETNANRIKNYLLSKTLRHEDVSDAEIKKVYGMDKKEFDEAVEKLVGDGDVDKE